MRHTGTVKWFKPDKGYGMIMPDEPNSGGVFMRNKHGRQFVEGQAVSFRMVNREGSAFMYANYVKVISSGDSDES